MYQQQSCFEKYLTEYWRHQVPAGEDLLGLLELVTLFAGFTTGGNWESIHISSKFILSTRGTQQIYHHIHSYAQVYTIKTIDQAPSVSFMDKCLQICNITGVKRFSCICPYQFW